MLNKYTYTFSTKNNKTVVANLMDGPARNCSWHCKEQDMFYTNDSWRGDFGDWYFHIDCSDTIKSDAERDFIISIVAKKLGESLRAAEPNWDTLSVTSVQVFPFKNGPSQGHIKGMANIVLNDQFLVRGLRIVDGANGLVVAYPIDPFYEGEYLQTVCNPMTRQLNEHIENCVLEKYKQVIK